MTLQPVLAGTRGIICPLATPLTDDERLDDSGFDRLVDRIAPVVHGIFVLGSSGELPVLDASVADAVVERVVDRVGGRTPVYVGAGDTSTRRTIANVRRVARAGIDYVVVSSPYYYPTDNTSLATHFLHVAEASPLPVVLYNIPQNTGQAISAVTVEQVASHPNIVGLKDSAGDMLQFERFLACRSDTFAVLQGREQLAAASLWRGGDGVISALANLAPELLVALWDAVEADDRLEADRLQALVAQAATLFEEGYWLGALQAALGLQGIGNGRPAAPIPTCTPEQQQVIARLLSSLVVTHG
ncbi:MAG: dihydrodipicolinate synthase family protein [Candidatus Limnocylindria bacterium]